MMKLISKIMGISTSVVFVLILLSAGNAHAQMKGDATLLILNSSYGTGTTDLTENSLDAWGFSGAVEKVSWDGKYATGFALGWSSFSAQAYNPPTPENPDASPNPDPGIYYIDTFPAHVYGKMFFGNPKVKGYLGAGVGAYMSKVETCGDLGCVTTSTGNFSLNAPLGVYLFTSKSVFFNANYVFNWLNDSPLKSDIAHFFNLGVGFQLGQ